jgi:hypothetical protein
LSSPFSKQPKLFLLAADLKESFYFLLMHHRALDLIKLFVVAKEKTPASTGAFLKSVGL